MKTATGKVLTVCKTESFLAKSLITKLEEQRIHAVLSHGSIKELKNEKENTDLIILFMVEEAGDMTETLVYIKDMAEDLDRKIILIGDQSDYETVLKTIPEVLIYRWFKRPLVMDELVDSVCSYLENSTGEKAKKNILIVDDDITYMRTVYEWLKDSYHVGMASNGVQAISYLAKKHVDLVLLDYEMPVANGPQVLEMLKSDSETGDIPVMFLTGHGDKDSVLAVVDLKPADYLLKTIDKVTLLNKLSDFFLRQR